MRFLFCDRIVRVEKGRSIDGVKSFSLSEEFLNGHFEKRALVPGLILIETMTQFLGLLINYSHDFRFFSIISLIENVAVTPDLGPGFKADIHAEIVSTSETDSLGKAKVYVDGEPIASAERMIYSHLRVPDPEDHRRRFEYFNRQARNE